MLFVTSPNYISIYIKLLILHRLNACLAIPCSNLHTNILVMLLIATFSFFQQKIILDSHSASSSTSLMVDKDGGARLAILRAIVLFGYRVSSFELRLDGDRVVSLDILSKTPLGIA